jgi:hypothetical protein
MTTKTLAIRKAKNGHGGIVRSMKGNVFLLFPYSHMVQLDNYTGGSRHFFTYANHSLPWEVVRRIIKKGRRVVMNGGSRVSGKIRNGWRYYYTPGSVLEIGCQKFVGEDLVTLERWAKQ